MPTIDRSERSVIRRRTATVLVFVATVALAATPALVAQVVLEMPAPPASADGAATRMPATAAGAVIGAVTVGDVALHRYRRTRSAARPAQDGRYWNRRRYVRPYYYGGVHLVGHHFVGHRFIRHGLRSFHRGPARTHHMRGPAR